MQRFVAESGAGLQGGSTVTVATMLESFMTTATLSPTTRQDWASLIDRYSTAELGDIPLWKLTARDCDQMYQRLRLGGLGASRVRNAHVILHRAVAQAVRWGWITRNPVSDATRPEVPRSTVTPPNIDDVRALLTLAEETDPVLSCWLDIATATGARRGEICALRWSDTDLARATVRIGRSVAATKEAGVYIKTTKTDRFRLVSLTDRAVRSLTSLHAEAELTAIEAGRTMSTDDLIFTRNTEATEPWRPELVTRRWERLRKRAGLEHVKLHGLRESSAGATAPGRRPPPERVDTEHNDLDRRYGFRSRPTYVRLRTLGNDIGLPRTLTETELRVDELAMMPLPVATVYVVENRATFNAFPDTPDSIVVFGSGYAVSTLSGLEWLHDRRLIYWGDIDTHGFRILSRLRALFPHCESMLMDASTLKANLARTVGEPSPLTEHLDHLTPDETRLYRDLREDRYGTAVRLEQERVSSRRLQSAMNATALGITVPESPPPSL